jgi:hypothetical protein
MWDRMIGRLLILGFTLSLDNLQTGSGHFPTEERA